MCELDLFPKFHASVNSVDQIPHSPYKFPKECDLKIKSGAMESLPVKSEDVAP